MRCAGGLPGAAFNRPSITRLLVYLQPAYARLGYPAGSLPVTECVAGEILSLPAFPEMTPDQVDTVISALKEFDRCEG